MLRAVISVSALLIAYCAYRYFKALQVIAVSKVHAVLLKYCKHVEGLPGLRPLLPPTHPFGALFPNNDLNPGSSWSWTARRTGVLRFETVPFRHR